MVRKEIVREGERYQILHHIIDPGALTWKERTPIVNPRTVSINDGLLGSVTDIRREGNSITAEIPDALKEDWDFSVLVNQSDRSTGRHGTIYIHSGEILAVTAYPRAAVPKEKE